MFIQGKSAMTLNKTPSCRETPPTWLWKMMDLLPPLALMLYALISAVWYHGMQQRTSSSAHAMVLNTITKERL